MPDFECCQNRLRGSPENIDALCKRQKNMDDTGIITVLQYEICTSLAISFMYLDMVIGGQVKTEQGKRPTKMWFD